MEEPEEPVILPTTLPVSGPTNSLAVITLDEKLPLVSLTTILFAVELLSVSTYQVVAAEPSNSVTPLELRM